MSAPTPDTSDTTARPMRVAYLTNRYPAVSHTFIRREILELERRGHGVERFSIRPAPAGLVDPGDIAEAERTTAVLGGSAIGLLARAAAGAITRPARTARCLLDAWRMGRRGQAGFARQVAYVAEALVLRGELARRGVGHVHVHFGTNPACVARYVRMLGGPGYSVTIHGPDEFDAPVGHGLREKIADARFVVAISDFTRAQLMRWADPADWGKLHVVHCTVGGAFLDDPAADPATGAPVFVNVGRMSAQKGQLVLLDAFARTLADLPEARLVIVGDGELRSLVERRIAELGIGDRVELTGSVSEAEVRRRLRAAHALVLPSSAEGLPMVIMEAFAMGTPVISTYIAGIPELIEDGRSGVLVPAGRADLLAAAMTRIARTPADERGAMAAAGRAAVVERHSTEREGAVLERLLLEHGGGGA